jgi:hypothetical protein
MAESFLHVLDPLQSRFTFQFFDDSARGFAEVIHGTIDEVWPKITALNTTERHVGIFVTINETDLKGRRLENVVRPRALFLDADGVDQVQRCQDAVHAAGCTPTMVVRTSTGRAHLYWSCDNLPREEFSALQSALIQKMGTDPAVKDLPRVMRLPGTLHLKDPNNPRLVTLDRLSGAPRRWKLDELKAAFGISCTRAGNPAPDHRAGMFPSADPERMRRLFGIDYLAHNDVSAGLVTNIEEIKSAALAIPPSAIATELEWTRVARGLAHEARVYSGQSEDLWHILDTVSTLAPGYDRADNRDRWLRYVAEALDRNNPITIATVFDIAKKNQWQGWSQPTRTCEGNAPTGVFGKGAAPLAGLSVSFSSIPHRRWLYGVDLVRGEISLLAAPGGVGKSSLAIGMMGALATGQALLGERICGNDLTTLYINGEDSTIEMRRRIWAFCLKHHLTEQAIDRFLLLGADDWRVQKLSFLRTEKGNSVLDHDGVTHLESILAEVRPAVLVLDPLVVFCGGGNLNDNAGMSLVLRSLKRLANKFDCAILILHHTRKGGDISNAEAIGGASAIVNLARRAIMAVPMTAEEAPRLGVLPSERFQYFKVVASKSNLAPRSDDLPWYKLCSIELPNAEPPIYASGDRVQAVERVHLPQSSAYATADDQIIKRAIFDTVERGKVIGGLTYPYSPNVTGARNERSLLEDAIAAVQKATAPRPWHPDDLRAVVERSIGTMKSEGWLVEQEIPAGRFRRGRALTANWTRTPWAGEGHTTPPGDGTLHPGSDPVGQWVNDMANDWPIDQVAGGGESFPVRGTSSPSATEPNNQVLPAVLTAPRGGPPRRTLRPLQHRTVRLDCPPVTAPRSSGPQINHANHIAKCIGHSERGFMKDVPANPVKCESFSVTTSSSSPTRA